MTIIHIILYLLDNYTNITGISSLRLRGGLYGSGSGRLEIYHDGVWGSICDDSFSMVDANVACRQIGFAEAERILSTSSDDYTKGTVI